MQQFLGKRLEALGTPQEVKHEEKEIRITGPLSEVFTQALNEHLKKDTVIDVEKPAVSQESFTDPAVVAEYLKTQQDDHRPGPTTLYAFDKAGLDERTFVDAALAVANTPEDETLIIVAEDVAPRQQTLNERLRTETYATALESLVQQRGGHFVHSPQALADVLFRRKE